MANAAEMKDHVYKILELVGSSEKNIEDAIQNALSRASKTIRDMKWASAVTDSNENEGFAKAVRKFVLVEPSRHDQNLQDR